IVFFFFQAEDGIRDDLVTGVQTCALPICGFWITLPRRLGAFRTSTLEPSIFCWYCCVKSSASPPRSCTNAAYTFRPSARNWPLQIGRASCRERVQISVDAGELREK